MDSTRSPLSGHPETPLLNAEMLEELWMLADGDIDFFQSLFSEMLTSTPGRLKELGTYLEQSDFDSAGKLLHKIKGGGATLGADGLSEICKRMQGRLNPDSAAFLRDGLKALHDEFQALQSALDEIIKNGLP